MPQTLTHSPAEIVQALLVSMGLGTEPDDGDDWPVGVASEPGTPDNAITIYDTTGTGGGRSMIDGELFGHCGVQIRVRAATHSLGWPKADAIQTALAESVYQERVTIDGSVYAIHCFAGIGDVIVLGKAEQGSKRSLFTINALVSLKQL